ncbi:hypothetical protein CSC04_2338 [Enterobacter roggenkampii]|nr:hypothetical protein CSC04_2338 [Enterobacter roggenkampii]
MPRIGHENAGRQKSAVCFSSKTPHALKIIYSTEFDLAQFY